MINFDKLEIFRIEKLQNLKLEKAQREEWGGELTFLNSSGELSESGASAALETVSPDKKNWSQFYAKSFAQLRFNWVGPSVFIFAICNWGAIWAGNQCEIGKFDKRLKPAIILD